MNIESLGHLVLKVTDLDRSRKFYHELLGLPISAESDEWRMIFFTLGSHHNFAIIEISSSAAANFDGVGVDHFAFKLKGGMDELQIAKQELEAHSIEVKPVNHTVSYSLYFKDPDGNELEIYVDGAEGWKEDSSLILAEARELGFS